MQAALRALNRLVADGVIGNYAIGGAIGASFYIDALQTEDIDVFVILPVALSGLVSLTPIYQALLAQGGIEEREYIRFGEWPVQVLTDANDLIAEAIREAQQVAFEEVPTRVFRAEHLCAVALQVGRSKDYLRVTMFLEQGRVDLEALRTVARRYDLTTQLTVALRQAGGLDAADR
jgi:hypothetical protein